MWISCPHCKSQFDGNVSSASGIICPVCQEHIDLKDAVPFIDEDGAEVNTPSKKAPSSIGESDTDYIPKKIVSVSDGEIGVGDYPTDINPSADTIEGAGDEARARLSSANVMKLDFGDYEILKEVNRGAMGIVYKARQKSLNRIVAIKVLIAGEHASEQQIARFRREALAIARLRHPNIVPVHEISEFQGKHYFTMDYISGASLAALIKEGTIQPKRALQIVIQIADALDYAHNQGVIHRDIKPGNIMIDSLGRPLLMDFGLAKQIDTGSKFTRSGTTIGTPAYMPPEQARGDLALINRQSDVYSLGAVLYEMLSGQPPFVSDNMLDVIMKVINEDPPPPRVLNPNIHRDIQTIIMKSMDKDPKKRYQTARAFMEDLIRYESGESIKARPTGRIVKLYKHFQKSRSAYASMLMMASIIFLAASIIYGIIERFEIDAAVEKALQNDIKRRDDIGKWIAKQIEAKKIEMDFANSNEWKWNPVFEADIKPSELWNSPGVTDIKRHWSADDAGLVINPGAPPVQLKSAGDGMCLFSFTAKVEKPEQYDEMMRRRGRRGDEETEPVINFFLKRPAVMFRYKGSQIYVLKNLNSVYQGEAPLLEWNRAYNIEVKRGLTTISVTVTKLADDGITAQQKSEINYADYDIFEKLRDYRVGFANTENPGILRITGVSLKKAMPKNTTTELIKGDLALLDWSESKIPTARDSYKKFIEEELVRKNTAKNLSEIWIAKQKLIGRYRFAMCYELDAIYQPAIDNYMLVYKDADSLLTTQLDNADRKEIKAIQANTWVRMFYCLGQQALSQSDPDACRDLYDRAMIYLEGIGKISRDNPWIAQIPNTIFQPMLNNRLLGDYRYEQVLRCFEAIDFPADEWWADLQQKASVVASRYADTGNWPLLKRMCDAYPNKNMAQYVLTILRRTPQDDEKIAVIKYAAEKFNLLEDASNPVSIGLANEVNTLGLRLANDNTLRPKLLELIAAYPNQRLQGAATRAMTLAVQQKQIKLFGDMLSLCTKKYKICEPGKTLEDMHFLAAETLMREPISTKELLSGLIELDRAYNKSPRLIALFEKVAEQAYNNDLFEVALDTVEYVYKRWKDSKENVWETPKLIEVATAVAEELSVDNPGSVLAVYEKYPSYKMKYAFIRTITKLTSGTDSLEVGRDLLKTLRTKIVPSGKYTLAVSREIENVTFALAELHYKNGPAEFANFFAALAEIKTVFSKNELFVAELNLEIADLHCFDISNLTKASIVDYYHEAIIKGFGALKEIERQRYAQIRLVAALIEKDLMGSDSDFKDEKIILAEIIKGADVKELDKGAVKLARLILGDQISSKELNIPLEKQKPLLQSEAKQYIENAAKDENSGIRPAEGYYFIALRYVISGNNEDEYKIWRSEAANMFNHIVPAVRYWPYPLIKENVNIN